VSKQSIVWQVLTRTLFGSKVVDTSRVPQPDSAAVN